MEKATKKKSFLKSKWTKRVITLAIIAGGGLMVFRSCAQAGTAMMANGYLPTSASIQNLSITVSGTGTISPAQTYRPTLLIQGEVLSAPFEEGQLVEKGDLLYRIDSSDIETSIKQAELSLQSAQLSYNQLLKTQKDNNENAQVKANATGVITKVYVDEGDILSMGTPIADILDRDNMKLTVPFHSAQVGELQVGLPATVMVDGTSQQIGGYIDSISAVDSVGAGGSLIREVTLMVTNPGALDTTSRGSATVGNIASAGNGNFTYASQKQLVAKTSGELVSLTIDEGSRVYENQIVGEFDVSDMDTQIKTSAIQVENAQLTLSNAKDRLKDYSITSNISGTVIEKNYEVGDNIESGSSVGTPAVIYDMSELTFNMQIHELDINKVKVGQFVEITSDALDGYTFTGTVDKVNINGTTAGGMTSYPVTVLLDGVPEQLYPGMNVSAEIMIDSLSDALCVPTDAVTRGSNGASVVTVAGAGATDETGALINASKLETREVTLGVSTDDFIEILSGLADGEAVYIRNQASNMMQMAMANSPMGGR